MANSWKTLKLGDVTKWSSGGTPKKSEASYWDGEIPWISASSMEGHLYTDSKLKITEAGLANGSRLAPKNSILLLVRGSILHQKMQVGLTTRPVAFNQDVKCLVADEEYLDPWYLLLWFKAKEQELLTIVESTGIGAGKFDTKLLSEYPIKIPPKDEREKIKEFGQALFDKSTNLIETNQTLEQMAQALFKSWFVDFDPVIDNALAAGKDIPEALQHKAELRKQAQQLSASPEIKSKPLPEDIRALFPSEFEQTHVPNIGIAGWIPKGWKACPMSELVEVASSKRVFAKDYVDSGVPFFRGKEITELSQGKKVNTEIFITEEKYQELKDKAGAPKEGDILITSVGTIGNTYLVKKSDKFYFKDGNLTWIKSYKKAFMPFYLKEWFNSNAAKDALERIKIGTTQQAITIKALNTVAMLNPTSEIIDIFEAHAKDIYQKHEANFQQINSLAKTRDVLLPKLISGDITINEDVA